MQWLVNICVRRPIFTWVIILTICVVGILSYFSLGLDQFPKVDFPTVLVTANLNGAAPEEVETDITDKLESEINTISGIDELRSTSSDGIAQVIVTFSLDKDGNLATQEVRDKINNILPNLPKGIDPPTVSKVDPDAAPILYITVKAKGSVRDITEIADKKIRRALEGISGVGQVTLLGGRKREIRVWIDPIKLRAAELTAIDVQNALMRQNVSTPGGAMESGPRKLTLRVEGRVKTVDAIGNIVVRQLDEHATRIKDVARVEDGSEDEATWASEDGVQTVLLSLRKQSGENTVAVVDKVKEKISQVEKSMPEGTTLSIVRDSSEVIRTSVHAVTEHLVLGSILAALVVLVFLGNLSSTLIAAFAIPVSIIGTFALMWSQNFTLNILTLLALALSVGIVIDDAIVVLENIVRFIHDLGKKPFPASILATRDISLAVLATTMSLLAVFIPVSFMNGIVGRFLKSFGLTMAFAIFVSFIVSFSLTPMLSARLLKPLLPLENRKLSRLERLVNTFYKPIEHVYMMMLTWVMQHRWVVVATCILALGSCVPLFQAVPKSFLPDNDEAQFEVNMRAPEGTSLQQTRLIAERIAQKIRNVEGVQHTLLTIGDDTQKTVNKAKIYVKLTEPKDRSLSQQALMTRVRTDIISHEDQQLRMDVSLVPAFSSGASNAAIQYIVSGPDLNALRIYTDKILEKFKKVRGAVDVDSNLIVGKPELHVAINRERAADLGVEVAAVADTLQLLVAGLKVSTYAEAGEDFDIRARAESEYRADAASLALITVPSKTGTPVPLIDLVSLNNTEGPSEINRLARQRQVTITANVLPGIGQSEVQSALEKIVANLHMPAAYIAGPTGQSKEMGKAAVNFMIAFGASFLFMYLVLAAQFESWLHPITILLALPLTVPFALLSLLIFGQPLSIISALGLLVLFGVVKKNAILQVDHTNHLRATGKSRAEAILEANKDRLRPILMTTVAFVAGMLPLIFAQGVGAGLNRATAGVVVGGQSLSLLLTLLATPVAYSLFDDLSQWSSRIWRSFSKQKESIDRGLDEIDTHNN